MHPIVYTFVNDIVCDARHKSYVITHVEQFSELEERLRLITSTSDYSYILYRLSTHMLMFTHKIQDLI